MDHNQLSDARTGARLVRQFEAQPRTPKRFRKWLKAALARLPSSHSARLLASWPKLREWQQQHLGPEVKVSPDRYSMYAHLVEHELPPRLCYLEFGCASGEVVRRWSRLCPHPDARFWGFDTFTGMPEEWSGLGWKVDKGAWSQHGKLPEVTDPRVGYVKGRFQDSLEGFLADTQIFSADFDHYVIHIDADLYSAALYVLVMMRPALDRATILFDEFDCVLDELRALEDFCSAFGYTYRVLSVADACEKVAIRLDLQDKT